MSKRVFITIFICLLFHINGNAQQSSQSEIALVDSCDLDELAAKSKKFLIKQEGYVYKRFGATIINIGKKAYNPCNLPPNLIGKKVLVSGIIYVFRKKTDGLPLMLTYLKVLSN